MSNLQWFRLYHRIIDDEKVRLIAFEDRWHFIAVCCLKADGLLDEPESALKWRKVAVKMGVQLRELDEIKRRLFEVGLVDETMQPMAWDELQYRSDTSTERVRKYREKTKAKQDETPRNVSVTAQDTETDTETEDKKAPLPPKGAGAVDLFDQVEEVFPRSPHYNQAKAERHWRKLSPADQRALSSKAQSFSTWWRSEQARRGRSMADSLAFAPPLDKWIGEGAWRSFDGSGPRRVADLPVLRADDPLVPVIERMRGKPIIFGTKGTTTVTPAELEQAKVFTMGQAGAA